MTFLLDVGESRTPCVAGSIAVPQRHQHVRLLEVVVGTGVLDDVPARQRAPFVGVVAHQGGQSRVFAGVRKRRQHRHLSNVTQAHDGVANRAAATH